MPTLDAATQAVIRRVQQLAGRAAKALARETRAPAFVAAYTPLPGGMRGLAWAADQITNDDVEKFVIALLERIRDGSAAGAVDCPNCAARLDRAETALAALNHRDGRPVGTCH